MRAGRRTQVAKGAVCKTAMRRFEPARRLHKQHLCDPVRMGEYFQLMLMSGLGQGCDEWALQTCVPILMDRGN